MIEGSKADLLETAYAEELERDTLKAVVEIYEESIVLRTVEEDGGTVKNIEPDELAQAMAKDMQVCSGLLSDRTLWWTYTATGAELALWEPPASRRVTLVTSPDRPPELFHLPMPGMVFIKRQGRPTRVFAATGRPTSAADTLYHAPTFNVFLNGSICPGSHRFPQEPERQAEAFFESHFSLTGDTKGRSQKHDGDILALWEELSGQIDYPLEDLVAYSSVSKEMGRR